MLGADIDTDGDGTPEHYDGNWGAYIMAPYTTFAKANKENRILKSTTAKELIVEDGRVKGVKAVMDDGTPVTAHAHKGVIIATGGYAANIRKVIDSNRYWNQKNLTTRMATTNRSSQRGDGLDMAEKAGAALTGMGWTQLMPLSYTDYGNLAFGSVSDAVFISPKNGRRFVGRVWKTICTDAGSTAGTAEDVENQCECRRYPESHPRLRHGCDGRPTAC